MLCMLRASLCVFFFTVSQIKGDRVISSGVCACVCGLLPMRRSLPHPIPPLHHACVRVNYCGRNSSNTIEQALCHHVRRTGAIAASAAAAHAAAVAAAAAYSAAVAAGSAAYDVTVAMVMRSSGSLVERGERGEEYRCATSLVIEGKDTASACPLSQSVPLPAKDGDAPPRRQVENSHGPFSRETFIAIGKILHSREKMPCSGAACAAE